VNELGAVAVREATAEDADWIRAWLRRRWGSELIAERGATYDASACPALVAERDGRRVGLATYRLVQGSCHLLTIDAEPERSGIGSLLLERLKSEARAQGVDSISLITTNDNLPALAFYQRRAFVLAELSQGAVDEARKRKPSIPLLGFRGIPVRDELRLEWRAR
jgi:ribosomal protein S18 acetylase RimI-like enzyme